VAPCSEAIVTSVPDPVLHRRRSVRIPDALRPAATPPGPNCAPPATAFRRPPTPARTTDATYRTARRPRMRRAKHRPADAAERTRTSTGIAHGHLKTACLPVPPQPQWGAHFSVEVASRAAADVLPRESHAGPSGDRDPDAAHRARDASHARGRAHGCRTTHTGGDHGQDCDMSLGTCSIGRQARPDRGVDPLVRLEMDRAQDALARVAAAGCDALGGGREMPLRERLEPDIRSG
jgi:hypothetical protein